MRAALVADAAARAVIVREALHAAAEVVAELVRTAVVRDGLGRTLLATRLDAEAGLGVDGLAAERARRAVGDGVLVRLPGRAVCIA